MSPLISTSLASSITQVDGFKASAVKTLCYHSLPLSLLRMLQAVQENEGKSCTWVVFPSLFQDQPHYSSSAPRLVSKKQADFWFGNCSL